MTQKAIRVFLSNDKNPSAGNNRSTKSASPPLRPKSLVLQGTLRSYTRTIKSGGKQAVLNSPVMQKDTENGSSCPGDSSNVTPNAGSWVSSAYGRTFSSRIANQLRDENPEKSLREVRKRLACLEKKKELISLIQKLNKIEAEKVAGFPLNHSSILSDSPEEAIIQRQIIQESKLTVPVVGTYSGLKYGQYQSFIRVCEHLFCTRPVTYRKDVNKVLYGIGALEGTPSITWYRHEEKFGRLDMTWDMFKTFLLDDLFPPEIRLRDVHKKYREAKQQSGQNVHGLIRYLEELEAQMVPVTEDQQMSTILGALHPWIEAQVSSRLESPKTKSELVQLALKVESTMSFRPPGASNLAAWGKQSQSRNIGEMNRGTRLGKRGRNKNDGSEFPVWKKEARVERDFSKIKCYNCGKMGHISAVCEQPHHEAGKV